MKKNKNLYIIIAAAVVVLLVVGGYLLFGNKAAKTTDQTDVSDMSLDDAIRLSPSDVGLELTATASKKQVKFVLSNASGINRIEYELSYEADSAGGKDDESGGRITRGVAGEDVIDSDQAMYESKLLDLGSCSSGTCRYDKGVTSVHLLLKLTKSDGKIYQVEQDLDLTN
jgi:hypothetical protein